MHYEIGIATLILRKWFCLSENMLPDTVNVKVIGDFEAEESKERRVSRELNIPTP
jgi:hypothetical protein